MEDFVVYMKYCSTISLVEKRKIYYAHWKRIWRERSIFWVKFLQKSFVNIYIFHSFRCSYHSNCSQHYTVGPATGSTPSALLTCGHITTSDALTKCLISSYFSRLRQNIVTFIFLLLKVIDPPNYVAMSVSLRGMCVCVCLALDNIGFQ